MFKEVSRKSLGQLSCNRKRKLRSQKAGAQEFQQELSVLHNNMSKVHPPAVFYRAEDQQRAASSSLSDWLIFSCCVFWGEKADFKGLSFILLKSWIYINTLKMSWIYINLSEGESVAVFVLIAAALQMHMYNKVKGQLLPEVRDQSSVIMRNYCVFQSQAEFRDGAGREVKAPRWAGRFRLETG